MSPPSFQKRQKKVVIGIDEVGRGPLAGPVLAVAVAFLSSQVENLPEFKNLKDSKQTNFRKREEIYEYIKKHPEIEYASGRVGERVIDKINILSATKLAMKRAVNRLDKNTQQSLKPVLFLDGNFKIDSSFPQASFSKGDEDLPVLKIASIIAKVKRDRILINYHKKYPQYGFCRHVGYGTREHREKIKKYGLSPLHRKSFKFK